MIRDADLRQAIDYSEGQKTAAYMVLGEIVNLLNEFSDNLRICQKLDEKFASVGHVGPVDVAAFLGLKDVEEKERIKQDAYQKIHYLVSKLKKG